jgi:putative ABC transport system permease protein
MSAGFRATHVFEGVRIALQAMRANKLRSALTILGVLIGVTTVMTMAALIRGLTDDITSQIEAAGPTTFYVVWWFNGGLQVGRPPIEVRQRPFPSDEEAEAIQRLPEIEYAQMYGVSNQRVTYRGEQTRAIAVYGSGRHGVEIDGGTIIAGRNFTPEEERQGGNVVVLYEQVVDRIFGRGTRSAR